MHCYLLSFQSQQPPHLPSFRIGRYPEPLTILVYGGIDEKFLKGAEWLKNNSRFVNRQMDNPNLERQGKKLMVFNLDELRAWVNNNM